MRLQVFWTIGLTRTTHIFNKRLKWHITDTLHILRFPRVLNVCSSLRTDVKYHKKTMALNYRRQRLSTIKSFWTDSAICGATQRWQSPSKAKQKEKRKKKLWNKDGWQTANFTRGFSSVCQSTSPRSPATCDRAERTLGNYATGKFRPKNKQWWQQDEGRTRRRLTLLAPAFADSCLNTQTWGKVEEREKAAVCGVV